MSKVPSNYEVKVERTHQGADIVVAWYADRIKEASRRKLAQEFLINSSFDILDRVVELLEKGAKDNEVNDEIVELYDLIRNSDVYVELVYPYIKARCLVVVGDRFKCLLS